MFLSALLGLGALVVGLPLLIVSAAIIPPWFGFILAGVLLIVWLRYRARRAARAPRDAHLMAEFNELGRQYRHWLEPMPESTQLRVVSFSPEDREALRRDTVRRMEAARTPLPAREPRESYPPRLPRKDQTDLTSFDDPYDDEDPDYEG